MSFGSKMPPLEPSKPIPVPQLDAPSLIDSVRTSAKIAADEEGVAGSLLTPGGGSGVIGSARTRKKTLG